MNVWSDENSAKASYSMCDIFTRFEIAIFSPKTVKFSIGNDFVIEASYSVNVIKETKPRWLSLHWMSVEG